MTGLMPTTGLRTVMTSSPDDAQAQTHRGDLRNAPGGVPGRAAGGFIWMIARTLTPGIAQGHIRKKFVQQENEVGALSRLYLVVARPRTERK
jgi:hypothetical protein